MLNISPNRIVGKVDLSPYRSVRKMTERRSRKVLMRLSLFFLILILIILFLPWTQNIRSKGTVTTLNPGKRPQKVQSVIAGQIQDWHVRQGTQVEAGDTILTLREVRDDFFDPQLLERTRQRLIAKKEAKNALKEKAEALKARIAALQEERELKLEQARNRIERTRLQLRSDSMDAVAAEVRSKTTQKQYERSQALQDSGLHSRTQTENRVLSMQEARAKRVAANNQVRASRNAWLNAQIERERIAATFRSKIADVRSKRSNALSKMHDATAKIAELENKLSNLRIRRRMHAVTAPQDGIVNRTVQGGVGETIKKGEAVAEILPRDPHMAVSMKVKPMNIPLIEKGQHVRIQFDGWPAVVFSGWPNVSYGTFGGKVVAVNQVSDRKGNYRVLIAPEPGGKPWPDELGIGSGADNMILLKDVPVWYEIWRRINGFPPSYYGASDQKKSDSPKLPVKTP